MSDYNRQYPVFSLCGLNCGLCPNFQSTAASRCYGCGTRKLRRISKRGAANTAADCATHFYEW